MSTTSRRVTRMTRGTKSTRTRVGQVLTVLTSVMAILIGSLVLGLSGAAAKSDHDDPPPPPPVEQVCTDLSSGKIDVSGSHSTLTISAPSGQLISQYCVKAGSVQQGNGPEYVSVTPPQASVTISHSSGKDISHYSAAYVPVPTLFTETATAGPALFCVSDEQVTVPQVTRSATWGTSEDADVATQAEAIALAQQRADAAFAASVPQGATPGECPVTPTLFTETATAGPGEYCYLGEQVTYPLMRGSATWGTSEDADVATQAEAMALAQQRADAAFAASVPQGATAGECPVTPTLFTETATTGPAGFCFNDGFIAVAQQTGSATWGTSASAEVATQAEALTLAKQRSSAAFDATVPVGATPGQCPVTPTPPPAPAEVTTVVSPVEVTVPPVPATVEEPVAVTAPPAAATVKVPTTPTIRPLPASVPAGGGSAGSQPSVPLAIALIALGAVGLLFSARRLVATRS